MTGTPEEDGTLPCTWRASNNHVAAGKTRRQNANRVVHLQPLQGAAQLIDQLREVVLARRRQQERTGAGARKPTTTPEWLAYIEERMATMASGDPMSEESSASTGSLTAPPTCRSTPWLRMETINSGHEF